MVRPLGVDTKPKTCGLRGIQPVVYTGQSADKIRAKLGTCGDTWFRGPFPQGPQIAALHTRIGMNWKAMSSRHTHLQERILGPFTLTDRCRLLLQIHKNMFILRNPESIWRIVWMSCSKG